MLRMHIFSKVKWRRGGWGLPSIIIYLEEIIFNNNNHLDFPDIPFQPREELSRRGLLPPILGGIFNLVILRTPAVPYMDLGRSLLPTKAPLQTKFEGSLVAFLRIWTAVLRTITSKTKEIIDLALVYSPLLISSCSYVYIFVIYYINESRKSGTRPGRRQVYLLQVQH